MPAPRARFIAPLTIAAQTFLKFLATALGDRDGLRFIGEVRQHGGQDRQIMAPECLGNFTRLVGFDAEGSQCGAGALQRRFEGLALNRGDAPISELQPVAHIAGARDDGKIGETLFREINQCQAVGDIIDRDHQQFRFGSAGCFEQIESRRITVEHLVAELAQRIDLIRVVVEHRDGNVLGKQHAPDDLSVACRQ
jgi:hypothetical protein